MTRSDSCGPYARVSSLGGLHCCVADCVVDKPRAAENPNADSDSKLSAWLSASLAPCSGRLCKAQGALASSLGLGVEPLALVVLVGGFAQGRHTSLYGPSYS